MGFVIVVVGAAYLLISIGVVAWAVSHAKTHGKNIIWWGLSAALVMWLIPFWDWIPTVVVHQYYCATEAGFWVYKTPEQWKKENPGVMETLLAKKGAPLKHTSDDQEDITTFFLNPRFNWVVKKTGPLLFNRWRREQEVVDAKTADVLARYVDFSTGNGNIGGEPPIRFWLQSEHCSGGEYNQGLMYSFEHNVRGAEK